MSMVDEQQKGVTVDLFIAESGVRTDLKDGVHLVQVVLSTAWMSVDEAAEFLKLSSYLAGVRATMCKIPKPKKKEAKDGAKA